jgi:hypothetical protein
MKIQYHFQITTEALGEHFSPYALQVILAANQKQDNLRGQIGHPEFHFDDNGIAEGLAYMGAQRDIILKVLQESPEEKRSLIPAWEAFGRLTHSAQDFYAHSNYAALWLAGYPERDLPGPSEIEPLNLEVLAHPNLCTGKFTTLELLSYVLPFLKPLAQRRLPQDTHLHMHLDNPERGDLFLYACAAARKRTLAEYEGLVAELSLSQRSQFCGRK